MHLQGKRRKLLVVLGGGRSFLPQPAIEVPWFTAQNMSLTGKSRDPAFYNPSMRTFRLKYLFCLILAVAVALMWWNWFATYSPSDHRANEQYMATFHAVHPGTVNELYLRVAAKNAKEDRTFYRQVIVTVAAGPTPAW